MDVRRQREAGAVAEGQGEGAGDKAGMICQPLVNCEQYSAEPIALPR